MYMYMHVCRGNIEPPTLFIKYTRGMAFEFSLLFTTYPSGSPLRWYTYVLVYSLFTAYPVESPTLHVIIIIFYACIHEYVYMYIPVTLAVYMYVYWHACLVYSQLILMYPAGFTTFLPCMTTCNPCWCMYSTCTCMYMYAGLSPYYYYNVSVDITRHILWQVLACNSCLCMFTVHVHAHAHVACMRWISLLLNLAAVL